MLNYRRIEAADDKRIAEIIRMDKSTPNFV